MLVPREIVGVQWNTVSCEHLDVRAASPLSTQGGNFTIRQNAQLFLCFCSLECLPPKRETFLLLLGKYLIVLFSMQEM